MSKLQRLVRSFDEEKSKRISGNYRLEFTNTKKLVVIMLFSYLIVVI